MIKHWLDIKGQKKYFPTGSRIICDPPVLDTDIDYVILVENKNKFEKEIFQIGFRDSSHNTLCNYLNIKSEFNSYKRDQINLIITESESFYNKFFTFTNEARLRNLTKKSDRVALCKSFLYGTNYTRIALMFWLDIKGFKKRKKYMNE